MAILAYGKSQFLARARLSYILDALSNVHYGLGFDTWKGDEYAGELCFDNGQGDVFVACWSEAGLVGLSLDHETEESVDQWELEEYERRPERLLPDLPESLTPLLAAASKWNQRVFTSGFWAEGDEPLRTVDLDDWGDKVLSHYALTDEEVLVSTEQRQGWAELHSLNEAQTQLALRLCRAAPPTKIDDNDTATILAAPSDDRGPADNVSNIQKTADKLTAVGITWTPPLDHLAQARQTRLQREHDE